MEAYRSAWKNLVNTSILGLKRSEVRAYVRNLSQVKLFGKEYLLDDVSNVTAGILSKTSMKIHHQPNNPICILKRFIEKSFGSFTVFEFDSPVVSVKENFDDLLFPQGHPGRSRNDTYYINSNTLLRSHTSAHQLEILKGLLEHRKSGGIATADVYRRDEIDSKHYPVFHQTELIKVYLDESPTVGTIREDLQSSLEDLVKRLFESSEHLSTPEFRWTETYFPFTDPSWEMEIKYKGSWLEILGCGIMRSEILNSAGGAGIPGWACGIGLERLCMLVFGVPDVRIFWSSDERFKSQFREGRIDMFRSFSKYPLVVRDMSFWKPEGFSSNSLMEIIRENAGDIVEDVKLVSSLEVYLHVD